MRGATYLHFQSKAVTFDCGETLTICSEGVGQSSPLAAPLCSFSDGEGPRHTAQSTGLSLGV